MPEKKQTDSEILKSLDTAELFLRNRLMDGQSLKLNEYDIVILKEISQTCAKACDEITHLQAENEELKSAINGFRGYEDKIKAEAYKEFAERLCEDRVSNDPIVIAVKVELKELVGEDK